jgi:hypothetical protein
MFGVNHENEIVPIILRHSSAVDACGAYATFACVGHSSRSLAAPRQYAQCWIGLHSFGRTALHTAAANGRAEIAGLLLDAKASVHAKDNAG